MEPSISDAKKTAAQEFFSVLWAVAQIAAVSLLVVADAFQSYSPEFPLAPTVLLAVGLHFAALIIVMHIGKLKFGHLKFHPLSGGNKFAVYQVAGFAGWFFCLFLLYWYFFIPASINGDKIPHRPLPPSLLRLRYGILTLSSTLSLAGGILLYSSLSTFDANDAVNSAEFLRRLAVSPNAETVAVLLLAFGNLAWCAIAEYWIEVRYTVSIVFPVIHVACGVITHVVIGWKYTPNYRLFMPFQGSVLAVIVEGMGWLFFVIALYVSFAIQSVTLSTPPSMFITLGSLSPLSILLLVGYCHLATLESGTFSDDNVSKYGSTVLTYVSLAHFLFLAIRVAVEMGILQVPEHFVTILSVSELPAFLVMIITPVLTHCVAWYIHEGYQFYQPFEGPTQFVALQGFGWTCFALAIFAYILRLSSGFWFWAILEPALALLSQLALHVSVPLFRMSPSTPRSRSARPFLQGEIFIGGLLSFISLALCNACDWLRDNPLFPQHPVMIVATIIFALSTPITSLAARRYNVLRNPLCGCCEYVILQAVAWTLYVALLFVTVLSVVPSVPFVTLGQHSAFSKTLLGGFNLVPCWICAAALYFQHLDGRVTVGLPSIPIHSLSIPALIDKLGADDVREIARLKQDCKCAAVRLLLEQICVAGPIVPPSPKGFVRSGAFKYAAMGGTQPHVQRLTRVFITGISIGTFLMYGSAGVLFNDPSSKGFVLAVLLAGFCATACACFGMHIELGRTIYGKSYRLYMPFEGGPRFVALQMAGWTTLTFCLADGLYLILACIYRWELGSTEALMLSTVAAVLSLLSQWSIFHSIWQFIPNFSADKPSFFEIHAEGIVSAIICFAALTLMFARDLLRIRSLAPLVTSFVALTLAAPLAVVALRKSARRWIAEVREAKNLTEDEDSDTETKASRAPPLVFLEHTVTGLAVAFPVLLLFGGYYVIFNFTPVFMVLFSKLNILILQVLLLVILATRTAESQVPQWMVRIREFVVIFVIFIWAFFVQYGILALMLFRTTGTITFGASLTFMLVVPSLKKIVKLMNYLVATYVAYTFIQNLMELDPRTPSDAWPVIRTFLFDMGFVIIFLMYYKTYKGRPEETGERYSPRIVKFLREYLLRDFEGYFQFRVLSDAGPLLRTPGAKYVFGFHPHGILAATNLYGYLTKTWLDVMGTGTRIVPHGASIMYRSPLFKDILTVLGLRVVTKATICRTLGEGQAVVLVPGGQLELVENHFGKTVLAIVTKHVGFIRLSIENQVSLVPMVSFGEQNVVKHVQMKSVQKYMVKHFQVAQPLLPFGRFYLPYCPYRTPLTLCVGRPVPVPPWSKTAEAPTPPAEMVQEVVRAYFTELRRTFECHKREAGYPDMQIQFYPSDPTATERMQGHPKKEE